MSYAVVLFAWRKPGLTPKQFRDHYENIHVPLLKKLAGPLFPLSHTRHYVQRAAAENANDTTNQSYPAMALAGGADFFDFDAYSEIVFEDEQSFQKFFAYMSSPDVQPEIKADEQKFLNGEMLKAAVLEDVSVTRR